MTELEELEELCRWLYCRGDGISFEDYDEDEPDDARQVLGDLEILNNYGTGELVRAIKHIMIMLNEDIETTVRRDMVEVFNARVAVWVDVSKVKEDYQTMDDDHFCCGDLRLALDKNGFEFKPEDEMMVVTGFYYLSPNELKRETPIYDGT